MAKLCTLSSSSSGNCTYIGSSGRGILVDAGISAKQIEQKLVSIGVGPDTLDAVFITHEHSDHVKGLRVFASKNSLPVYTSLKTGEELIRCGIADGSFDLRVMDTDEIICSSQKIRSFKTSHDSVDSHGFSVETSDDRKVSVVTDTGCITDEIRQAVSGCDYILLESNHDVGMLRNGRYPYHLKRRILSPVGHLSNAACADFALELIRGGTTGIVLGHLSKENNVPGLAYQTTKSFLDCNGCEEMKDYVLKVALADGPLPVVI